MLLRLDLSVESQVLPAILTVKDLSGNVFLRKTITSTNVPITINVCTCGIAISILPVSGNYYQSTRFIKTFALPDCCNIRLYFAFRQTGSFLQNFYLYDKTYLLPVKYATLYFTEK